MKPESLDRLPAPSPINVLLEEGYRLFSEAKWREAGILLTQAIELDASHHELFGALGIINFQLGEYADSCRAFQHAVKLNPTNVDLLVQLAMASIQLDDRSDAEDALQKALVLDPANVAATKLMEACRNGDGPRGGDAHLSPAVQTEQTPRPAANPGMHSLSDTVARAGAQGAIEEFYLRARTYFADVAPPELSESHLQNSRLVPSRNHILGLMPKCGVCAEIGTQTGFFAKRILSEMRPAELHIFDVDFTPFDIRHFESFVASDTVQLHQGDSSSLLRAMPDKYFDFIYVDGDHSYDGATRDLVQASRVVKDDGWIVCNDYTVYSPLEKSKYGVARAVNELCINHGFEIVYFGLQKWSYHDVALRKIQSGPIK